MKFSVITSKMPFFGGGGGGGVSYLTAEDTISIFSVLATRWNKRIGYRCVLGSMQKAALSTKQLVF